MLTINVLLELEAWLMKTNPALMEYLLPGLNQEQIDAALQDQPFCLSTEMQILYGWHNGTSSEEPPLDVEVDVLPGHYFLSFSEALPTETGLWIYNAIIKVSGDLIPPEVQTQYCLEIFSDGAGGRYYVPCLPNNTDESPVLYYEPESLSSQLKNAVG